MLIIKIDEKENLDFALKRLKKKFEKAKIAKEIKKRSEFIKPSVRRREEIKKAIYVNRKYRNKE